tara:strand:- start:6704 stop:7144 length:441 start_codon:yes stop_codon:yes gene_type:complete
MQYILLAGFSALFFVIMELVYKFTNSSKINSDLFVTLWYILNGVVALAYFFYKNYHKENNANEINNEIIYYILLMSILSFVGNLVYWNTCKNIKNPGITRAIYSGVLIMLLAIISAITFKKYLKLIQFFSIILIIIGITLLLINSD